MGQAGFRTDWDRGTRDTFTFQGDVYRAIAGETTTYALYSPASQVVVDANAQLTGGNLLARWKRVLNDRSDFQVQAYFDRTNHFEPEFGETRDTFDIDFLHHLTLPGQQNFLWGVGARVSPSNIVQIVPTLDFQPRALTDHIYSAFVQDEIPFFNRQFSLTLGSKFGHDNYNGFDVQPSARLLWNRTPDNPSGPRLPVRSEHPPVSTRISSSRICGDDEPATFLSHRRQPPVSFRKIDRL